MIDRIMVQNAQSIKDLAIDLGRVTVIVGETDTGKTAMIRAVLSMLTNDYYSDLLRTGEKSLNVSMVVDGVEVGFSKGNSNSYYLGNEKFSKVGRDVPVRVRDFLGLRPIKFDKDIQFFLPIQTQHQSEFLVDDYGGVTSKVIGKLSNLGLVYGAMRHVNNVVKKTRVIVERLEEQQKSLIPLRIPVDCRDVEDKIHIFESLVGKCKLIDKILAFNMKKEVLTDLVSGLNKCREQVSRLEEIKNKLEGVKLLLGLDFSLKNKSDRIKGVDIAKIDTKLLVMSKIGVDLDKVVSYWEKSTIYHNHVIKAQVTFDAFSDSSKELNGMVGNLSVCPTCMQPLSEERKREICHL